MYQQHQLCHLLLLLSMRHHDSPRKNRFIGALQAGSTISKAAKENDIPYATAHGIAKKFRATGSTHRRSGSGRPPKTTARVKRALRKEAKQARRAPLHEIGRHVSPRVSASTVRRVLAETGMHRRRARAVIFLKPQQREGRRKWAEQHRDWNMDDFERIIYSDESYITLGDSRGTVWVTRTADEVYHDDCVVPKFKQSSLRIMVWGCIMKGRKGPMVILEYPGGRGVGMTAARYQDQVLEKVMHDFYMEMSEEQGQVLFQQDGAPCHTAKSTGKWLELNHVEQMPHPAASPDLNPIEPLWHTFKELIRNRHHIPTTIDELKIAAKEAWDQISIADIDKHVKTMEDRVRAVLRAQGSHTSY